MSVDDNLVWQKVYLNLDLDEHDVGFAQPDILLVLINPLKDDNYRGGINLRERGICTSSSEKFYLFDFCENTPYVWRWGKSALLKFLVF